MGNLEANEKQLVRIREDRGVDPNGQRQRSHCNCCKSSTLAEYSQAIALVRSQFIPPPQPERSPHALLVHQCWTHCHTCASGGFGSGVAGCHQIMCQTLQVIRQLSFHLRLKLVPACEGPPQRSQSSYHTFTECRIHRLPPASPSLS